MQCGAGASRQLKHAALYVRPLTRDFLLTSCRLLVCPVLVGRNANDPGHRNANDPGQWYEVVYFESERKARANERSQKHQELLGQMLPLIDGQPEYVDLTPVQETRR